MRKLKKERGEELGAASSRRGAAGYTRFGGSSDTSRGRAITISVTSTAKPSSVVSKSKHAEDDSQVKRVVSPQQANIKTITVKSPEPVVNKSSAVKSPEPEVVKSPEPAVKSPEPVVKSPEPVVKSPEPAVKSPVKSPEIIVKSPEPVISKPPDVPVKKAAEDDVDIGFRRSTRSATSSKQPSSKTSEEKAEFQGFKLRKTGLSVKDKSRSTAASKNKVYLFSIMGIHVSLLLLHIDRKY